MSPRPDSLTDRLAERRALRFWARAAEAAPSLDLETLRALRGRARRTRREIDRLIAAADGRLSRPLLGSNVMNRPVGADWLWRPAPWRAPILPAGRSGVGARTEIADGVALFHDCPLSEIGYRQLRNSRTGDLSPFGLRFDVLGFEGKFLSLALDLPDGAREGFSCRQVFRAEMIVASERPAELYARLNVEHGPNTAQLLARVPESEGERAVEFDLGDSRINEKRVVKIWLDLIFDQPAMNAITLRDLTMSRRPRAEL